MNELLAAKTEASIQILSLENSRVSFFEYRRSLDDIYIGDNDVCKSIYMLCEIQSGNKFQAAK